MHVCMYYHHYSNHYRYNDKEQESLTFGSTTGFILPSFGKYPAGLCHGEVLAMFLSEGGSLPVSLLTAKERLNPLILGSVPHNFYLML